MSYKIIKDLLTPNEFTRTQKPIGKIKGIVIHYVASTNGRAEAVRNFWERLKDQKSSDDAKYASAHEIIDLNGDIVISVPKDELAYHCGSKTYTPESIAKFGSSPNKCTYGIECTHIKDSGEMSPETYETLVHRVADLCEEFGLNPLTDVWTHQEVVGWKVCHKWFVENPREWLEFKAEANAVMHNKAPNGKPTPSIPNGKPSGVTPTAKPSTKLFRVSVIGDSVNIRTGAGTQFDSVGILKKSDEIDVIGTAGDWYKTVRGYIFSKYVKKV